MLTIELVGSIASILTWRGMRNRFRRIEAKAIRQRFSATFIRMDWKSGGVSEEWIVGGSPVCEAGSSSP
jgi:hypothetical protein